MAIYGYTKNYKLIKPQYDTDTWHDYEYDNLDTIDAVLSAIYASGNWKGFWATNTAYVVGDVVIDRDTDTMYKVMVEHTTSEATFAAEQTAHPDYYELWSPNNLAESWAIKTDGKVSNEDYSAKAYAISSGLIDDGSAKEWAIGSGAIGNTNEYSAKKYATDAHNDYISLTTNVNVAAVGSNIANVNAVGQSISNVNTVASNVSSVNTVGNNISSVNTAASNMPAIKAAPTAASNAANSANNSHIWAEGTDAQVAALGGVHSSKGWAQQSTNANIALTNSPYTTNRILEIPQDIKLELNNGTLTLKSGSKVYVPNGFESDGTTPKFNVVTLTEDKPRIGSINSTGTSMVCTSSDGAPFVFAYPGDGISQGYFSGPTAPTGHDYMIWYDTANNIVKSTDNGGSTWASYVSFPIAIVSYSSNSSDFTSIDQVFNGFGYIGSTVFVLPGVKVQIPNGRNADGTCKSVYGTIRTVQQTSVNPGNGDFSIRIGDNYIRVGKFVYDAETNYNYNQTVSPSNIRYQAHAGTVSYSSGKITSLKPYTVDSVLNSNLSNLSAAGQNVIQNIAAKSGNPTGTIIVWSASTPPEGYLICNGAAVSRTTYAALFKVIGTTWGAGDGNTTFNVPNFTGAKLIRGNSVPVYGSGKGLRLTNNASNVGGYMFQHVFDSGAGEFDTSIYVTNYASDANVGTAQSGGLLPNNIVLGVPTKAAGNFDSGLEADLSNSQDVLYYIKY